jgi:protein phosphatase
MTIQVPADAMVVLVGPSGSGKSTFAARHFAATEVLSSDTMRAMVADDPNDQAATEAAFELLHTALGLRLARRRLTVVDATNVERWARAGLLAIARRHHRPAAAIAFALPVAICLDRNATRSDRRLPPAAIRRQHRLMTASLGTLDEEGFSPAYRLDDAVRVEEARVERPPGRRSPGTPG